ncbi:MAG: hypothetical protein ABEI07_02050 [Candidatus Nanohaloarchaea archaeon]
MTHREVRDLAVSTVGLGVAFTFLFFPEGNPLHYLSSPGFIPGFIAATSLVAVSFVPHEMAHRTTARAIDAYAEFKMWVPGVVIAVLSSLAGFVFAAPGGVEIYTKKGERYGRWQGLNPKQIGLVSVVGPMINISLAVIFVFASEFFTVQLQGLNLLLVGGRLNSFLAVFNLLPFYPLDGYKVMRWSIPVWVSTAAVAVLTFFL